MKYVLKFSDLQKDLSEFTNEILIENINLVCKSQKKTEKHNIDSINLIPRQVK